MFAIVLFDCVMRGWSVLVIRYAYSTSTNPSFQPHMSSAPSEMYVAYSESLLSALTELGDKSGSKCLRCQRSGRECVPAPGKSEEISFRHGQNPSLRKGPPRYGESDLAFPDDQVWVETSSSCMWNRSPCPFRTLISCSPLQG